MRTIKLVCEKHNEFIEISQEVYDFLKRHMIIKHANQKYPKAYKFVLNESCKEFVLFESCKEEFE